MHITELTQTLVALPLVDRLAAMEALWGSFDPVEQPTPDWHKDVLDQRWNDMQTGDVKTFSLEEVRLRLSKLSKVTRV
jgi:putative addiction module component (TIGR02574 family)